MIETLRIEGVAIVDRAELEFGPGLNVLTGETGAGKSIVLGALALLSGARASASSVRKGSPAAVVEAAFRTVAQPELEARLAARGVELDDHELIVRRTVSEAGRSRAQLAGQLVPVSSLAELFDGQLEISSQHDSQGLRRPDVQAELLDRIAGAEALRDEVAAGYGELRELDAELGRLRERSAERARQRDFLAFQIEEIEGAELDPEETDALRNERNRLAHAGRLGDDGGRALAALLGDPQEADAPSAGDLLGDAAGRLEQLAELDPALAELAERLASTQAELRESALDLERYLANLEADPSRLAQLDERLHRIEGLERKYGGSVSAVLAFRDGAASELAELDGADERIDAVLADRDPRVEALSKSADKLSGKRRRAAKKLGTAVAKALAGLAMEKATFAVELSPVDPPDGFPCGPSGKEGAEFGFSANPGEAARPLRKVASGGELSRVFLAIKNAARGAGGGMVLVFDEVDAGIGGVAAERVGRTLAELAEHHQVLCITHLPQVAACASTHFRVEKSERAGRTLAQIARVEGSERVEEIARMAGGESLTEATRKHARALLRAGAGVR